MKNVIITMLLLFGLLIVFLITNKVIRNTYKIPDVSLFEYQVDVICDDLPSTQYLIKNKVFFPKQLKRKIIHHQIKKSENYTDSSKWYFDIETNSFKKRKLK